MKILLVGEYSNLHKSLKEGLVHLGHEVTVVGLGDGFKQITTDINLSERYTSGFPLFIKKVIYKLFKTDITSLSIRKQFFAQQNNFTNYDVVQLINENAFKCIPKIEKQLLQFIFDQNKNVFLLSCGTDHLSVKYAFEKKFRYSILTPYFEKKGSEKLFMPATKYLTPAYEELHKFIYQQIRGIIASDLDYHIPLIGNDKYLGMIPNPVNATKIPFIPMTSEEKIVIFHGINTNNYYKKGNDIFEDALAIVQEKFPKKVEVITTRSVPYAVYIESYNRAHILLDQIFAYDQGFNALEAMSKGKVVFTGAEKEWCDYYGLTEDTVAINALPDANAIAEKIIWLVKNPLKIIEIGQAARTFVEKEHDYIKSAKSYVAKWTSEIQTDSDIEIID